MKSEFRVRCSLNLLSCTVVGGGLTFLLLFLNFRTLEVACIWRMKRETVDLSHCMAFCAVWRIADKLNTSYCL